MQDIHAALREAERVQKKQRTSASATAHCIDSLLQTLREARVQTLQQPQCSTSTESAFLSSVAGRLDENVKVASVQKELHASVSKWGKVHTSFFLMLRRVPEHFCPAGFRKSFHSRCMQSLPSRPHLQS